MTRFQHAAWLLVAMLAVALVGGCGCDTKKPTTANGPANSGPIKDAEVAVLAQLDTQPDLAHCRTALQQLDNLDSAHERPVLSDSELGDLTTFLRLTPAEVADISHATFSQSDAAYLEECLLIRAGIRSLRIDSRQPLERARLGFDWACRMVYVDDRAQVTTNPWTTLQAGSGVALSRAYVILATWQQLGFDGCLIGPPGLKTTPSLTIEGPGLPFKYAPVRACGVKIGSDLFLFDHTAGQAIATPDGKGVLTLGEAKASPEAVKSLAGADEVKSWQPFLAPSLASLSRRMEWLEKLNPGGTGINLFVNVRALRSQFAADQPGQPIDGWNPDGDLHSATRVLGRLTAEDKDARNAPSLRDEIRLKMTPLEYLANSKLSPETALQLRVAFVRMFEKLRYSLNSPRDAILRGHFSDATTALNDVKNELDNARQRIEQDKTLQAAFDKWAVDLQSHAARVLRARERDPDALPAAMQEFDKFRSAPENRDIEGAYILGMVSRPLGAEVHFLLATCVHERAERAQLDKSDRAPDNWKNAREWWNRYLEASNQARSPFPVRDTHARALLARCQQFQPK
jgi:hypothetical protein